MKKIYNLGAAALLLLAVSFIATSAGHKGRSHPQTGKNTEKERMPKSMMMPVMAQRQFDMLHDPVTGIIPVGIRSAELEFARRLPKSAAAQDWDWRGPDNIGGRMLCIAADLDHPAHWLSGSATGGMWETTNGGITWNKVTAPDAEQSATCVTQDQRAGKRNIWYYGTGELLSTTDRNVSTNTRTIGIGNGIFKSTDNGATWTQLPSTLGGTSANLTEIFQGVWRIVTDPVITDRDVVMAACYGAIMRSVDGGQNWQVSLGDVINKSYCTDIAVTSAGVYYAALSGFGWGAQPPNRKGIWRSTDGINWKEITPRGFPTDNRVTRLAIAPSDQNIVYVFTESQSPDLNPFNGYTNSVNTFWKMNWKTQGDSAAWEDRTSRLPGAGNGSINSWPYSLVVYGGYCMTMAVKPDDSEKVFLGGMCLYRSDNAFADSLQTNCLGGSPYDMDSLHQLHPDIHSIMFDRNNPNIMVVANDGGVYLTADCLADSLHIRWNRLNDRLTTTQFYSVAIDHSKANDDWILGGLQDNNWYYTVTHNPAELWLDIDICYDGFDVAVAPNWEYSVISAYSGNIWTCRFDAGMHAIDIAPQLPDTLLKYYDPVMGSNSLFPFYQNLALDPNNSRTFYLPTVNSIWRKDDMKAAAYDTSLRNAGWNHLSHVDVGPAATLSALSLSRLPANRMYYGSSLGRVWRLDNANSGDPVPVEVTGANFPPNAFVSCLDVDPFNADRVICVFSNYGVRSLFFTADGGLTWTPVGGNLEENPDGSGSGPSVRWCQVLTYDNKTVYFAGTSVGLFTTTALKGDSTIWVQEGAGNIGNVIVDMIDSRPTDGFTAIATHGNGVYSALYRPSSGIAKAGNSLLGDPYPVPSQGSVNLPVTMPKPGNISIRLYSSDGRDLGIIREGWLNTGSSVVSLALNAYPPGVYYLLVSTPSGNGTCKIVVGG